MTDDPHPEGWRVPQRPAMIGAVAVPLVLLIVLLIAGRFYDARLRPQHRQPVTSFPAPGIETHTHDGQGDPPRVLPKRGLDPRIEAAKRAVVADGIAGWR